VRAVVSNEAGEGGGAPFRAERIPTVVATLACALVPGSGGAPEKRFAIMAGRAPIDEVRQRLLESRDWLGPEQYARALENAGVTRSLMSILATEQGRTNALFEVKPRELFQKVLEMLGERRVLERYREARRKYEDARVEVDRQASALVRRQGDLQRVLRQVTQLDEWEAARDKVADLEARLPAADLQGLLRRQDDATRKIPELRTKVRNAELEQRVLESGKAAGQQERAEAEAQEEDAKRADEAAQGAFDAASRREAVSATRLGDVEKKATKLGDYAAGDVDELQAEHDRTLQSRAERQHGLQAAQRAVNAAGDRLERLRAGAPLHPESVSETVRALTNQGIECRLLADIVSVTDAVLADAAEAALGDARYALLVATKDEQRALAAARERRFPGPVYAGPKLDAEVSSGALILSPGAPTWITAWMSTVALTADGEWSDARGVWVHGPQGHVLGGLGRQRALEDAERALVLVRADMEVVQAGLPDANAAWEAASAALTREQQRRALMAEVAAISAIREEAEVARRDLDTARFVRTEAIATREIAQARLTTATLTLATKTKDLEALNARLDGERTALLKVEAEAMETREKAAVLAESVRPDLRARAERGDLDSADTVGADLDRAKRMLKALPDSPPAEVRDEAKNLKANVEELERHLGERRAEADAAAGELTACRVRYLDGRGLLSDHGVHAASTLAA
jgi:chromosome segregation ATPase